VTPVMAASVPILVTGGCGFIGVNLARALVANGQRAWAFDDLSTGSEADGVAAGFERVIHGDVRDAAAISAAVAGVETVVHLAAHPGVADSVADPRHDFEINVAGTLNTLLAARDAGVARFVFASSNAPLGDAEPPAREDVVPRPRSPYGASKLSGEAMCSAFAGSYGLATTVLRFSNVYGPFSYHKGSVVALFMKRVLDGLPVVVYGDGSQTRDFVFIGDLCSGIVAAIDRAPAGETYHLGTGIETSLSELVQGFRKVFTDRDIVVEHQAARAGDVDRSYSDITKARAALGYDPATPLVDGLRATRDWFVGAAA
jgi:UDP-glucose 4-epimerase